MKMLLIDGNTEDFPAYLESISHAGQSIELLYTDTVEAGVKQIKKGGVGLVLLAKPLLSSQRMLEEIDPELRVISIEGPEDQVFETLSSIIVVIPAQVGI